jgi:hypothetical protein
MVNGLRTTFVWRSVVRVVVVVVRVTSVVVFAPCVSHAQGQKHCSAASVAGAHAKASIVTSATASTVDVEREQRGLVIDARGRGAGREVS